MRFCNIFRILPRGGLQHYKTAYAESIAHAESICDECYLRSETGEHFLLTVLDEMQEKVVHTYTTKDHVKKKSA